MSRMSACESSSDSILSPLEAPRYSFLATCGIFYSSLPKSSMVAPESDKPRCVASTTVDNDKQDALFKNAQWYYSQTSNILASIPKQRFTLGLPMGNVWSRTTRMIQSGHTPCKYTIIQLLDSLLINHQAPRLVFKRYARSLMAMVNIQSIRPCLVDSAQSTIWARQTTSIKNSDITNTTPILAPRLTTLRTRHITTSPPTPPITS